MTTLEKMNTTLDELEKEVKKVKSLSGVLSEAKKINQKTESLTLKVEENIEILNTMETLFEKNINENRKTQDTIIKKFEEFYEKQISTSEKQSEFHMNMISMLTIFEDKVLKQILTESNRSNDLLVKKFEEIHNEQLSISEKQIEFQTNMISNQATFVDEVLNQIKTLKTENTRTLLELEKILTSKLDRNKSDVEVELRNLEKFLNEKFDNANKKQMENQKKNMIVGISTGVLIVLSIIINLFF